MKRPVFVNALALMTDEHLHIKSLLAMRKRPRGGELIFPRVPITSYRLFKRDQFKIKIVGLEGQREIYEGVFESDRFGAFSLKIALDENRKKIHLLNVYELSKKKGLEILVGTLLPLKMEGAKKILICDFDKTLVDTRYTTMRDLFSSLIDPIESFPPVESSIDLIKKYISQGFHLFILSASPHFYEEAIRDWLYKNQIFTTGLFLKDYRQVFSFFERDLTPKDLKAHGTYKLNQLLDILLMTGPPDELVLMGDNFESDLVVYLTVASFFLENHQNWALKDLLENTNAYQINDKQHTQLLSKIYQVLNYLKNAPSQNALKIHIRKKNPGDLIPIPHALKKYLDLVEFY